MTVVGAVLLGLGMAMVLNERFMGRGAVRSVVLVPWAISLVVVGFIWSWIFDASNGSLNALLTTLGLIDGNIAFMTLFDGGLAIYLVALAFVWNQAPLAALLFLSGLQGIPPSLYGAAITAAAAESQPTPALAPRSCPHVRSVRCPTRFAPFSLATRWSAGAWSSGSGAC